MPLHKKIAAVLNPQEKRSILWLGAVTLLLAFVEMASVVSILPFLSIAADPSRIQASEWLLAVYGFFGFTSERHFLVASALVVVGVLIVTGALQILVIVMQQGTMRRLNVNLSRRLMAQYLYEGYVAMAARTFADLQRNLHSEVNVLTNRGIIPVLVIVQKSLSATMIGLIVFIYEPLFALIAFAIFGGGFVGQFLLIRRHVETMARDAAGWNERRYRSVNEALAEPKLVSLHHLQRFFLDRFVRPLSALTKIDADLIVYQRAPKFIIETLVFSGMLLFAISLILTRDNFADSIPVLGFFAVAGYRLMPALQMIYQNYTTMKANLPRIHLIVDELQAADAEKLEEILQQPKPKMSARNEHDSSSNTAIKLEGVSYRYPSIPEPVFVNLNLAITADSTVGICGPTGIGKTTLVDLMLGLLPATAGTITVFGRRLDQTNIAWWQDKVSYVPQDIYLCDMSIADNIAFGDLRPDEKRIREAADQARIADFIESLPDGYESRAGEKGVLFSGGQRQRIGIARALYRRPQVLVFDEATSSLDNETEAAVMEAVNNLAGKMTIIMIAHRLTTLRHCDTVFELRPGGQVVARQYSELLQG